MFTNTPFEFAKWILRKFYYLIQRETSVPVELFIEFLTFLVDDMAYFTYKDGIYTQNRGLAMGNSLSQCLAEIVTSFIIYMALLQIDKNKITFLVKFLNDIGGAMDIETISTFESYLNGIVDNLHVDREDEDEKRSVFFLNCKMFKREDNIVGFSWWHKPFSSRQIKFSFEPPSCDEAERD